MFEAEIERGAKLLDKDDPGWALESAKCPIDVERLDMGSSWKCILGQHGGGFLKEAIRLGLWGKDMEEWGFAAENSSAYLLLTAEWSAFIRKRRKDAALALSRKKGRKP